MGKGVLWLISPCIMQAKIEPIFSPDSQIRNIAVLSNTHLPASILEHENVRLGNV